jgi:hypothetical protein
LIKNLEKTEKKKKLNKTSIMLNKKEPQKPKKPKKSIERKVQKPKLIEKPKKPRKSREQLSRSGSIQSHNSRKSSSSLSFRDTKILKQRLKQRALINQNNCKINLNDFLINDNIFSMIIGKLITLIRT